ncbi:centrosomal protein of 135 kDa-like isoform X5 [Entelurus aequoreus]|uniref:centrosomal protein of 135 kDa-like isoform X5 n=1 Tax=Entelurus aequoreus TaxID=161455 RepID=UPI002B1D8B31|nr:centrosomal protein of 135 kDa-like isoform X5 [Entelurus aequoreus]
MDGRSERRMLQLRSRLDMLGYTDHLGADSLSLVERLFCDMVHTTESLRKAKRLAGKSEKEIQNCDVFLEPYRAAHDQLDKKNRELQMELLTVKGEKDLLDREMKIFITKQEDELSSLKSLNKQYMQQVRYLEKDSKEKAKTVRQLRKRNSNAVVQAGDEKRISPPSPRSAPHPVDDAYVADILKQADERIFEMHDEAAKLKADLENAQGQVQFLNNHIDDMQEANNQLKRKLEGAQQKYSTKVADLTSKNRELCGEFVAILDLARQMELDNKQKLKTADTKFQDMDEVVQKQKEVIKDLEDELGKISVDGQTPASADGHRQETKEADHQNVAHSEFEFIKSHLGEQLVELRGQNKKLEGMVDFLGAEKSRLQDKVEKLMSFEKVLVLDLEGMRNRHGICRLECSSSRLDAFVKSLEEERDHYRQEVEHYKVFVASSHSPGKQKSPKSQYDHKSSNPSAEILNLKDALRLANEKLQQVTAEKQSLMGELKQTKSSAWMESNIQQVTDEKEAAMENNTQEQVTQSSKNLNLKDERKQIEEKLQLVLGEKQSLMDKCQQMELQCEQHSSELISLKEELRLAEENKRRVTAEKDSVMEEVQQKHTLEIQTLKEGHKLAEDKTQQATTEKESLIKKLTQHQQDLSKTSDEISKLKEELKLSKAKTEQVAAEKDSLAEELKRQLGEHNSETSAEILKLKEQLNLAEKKVQEVISEKGTHIEELKEMQLVQEEQKSAAISNLEEELKRAKEKIEQFTKVTEKIQVEREQLNLNASEEALNFKEQLKQAEEKIQQVMAEKDSLIEELKQKELQHEQHTSTTSEELSNLKEELRQAKDKIQKLMDEKVAQIEEFKQRQLQSDGRDSKTVADILNLKEGLKLAEDKYKQVTAEKDSLVKDLEQVRQQKEQEISRASDEILKLKKQLTLTEEKVNEMASEKEAEIEELRHEENSSTAAEILKLKKQLNLSKEKVLEVSSKKDAEMEELKNQLKLTEEKAQEVASEKDAKIEELKNQLKMTEDKVHEVASEKDAEMEELKNQLKLTEEKAQEVASEKDSEMEELKHERHNSTSAEILKLKKQLNQAQEKVQDVALEKDAEIEELKNQLKLTEEKAQEVASEKDTEMEELKHEKHNSTSAEILKLKKQLNQAQGKVQELASEKDAEMEELKNQLKLTEEKVQEGASEKDTEMEELKHEKQSSTSAEILKLKKQLNLAKEKVQDVASEKDAEMEELKNQLKLTEEKVQEMSSEKDAELEELKHEKRNSTSADILKLKQQLNQAKEKVREVASEKDAELGELKQKQLENEEQKLMEIANLEEELRLAEEKIQEVMDEKDAEMEEQKQKQLEIEKQKSVEIANLEEELKLAEEKVQEVTDEKDAELEEMKNQLKLTEEKVQDLASEKDADMEEPKHEKDNATAAEILKLKKQLQLAKEKVREVASKKDAELEVLKQTQLENEEQKSVEIANLEEELKLAEEKVQEVMDEKETLMEATEQTQRKQEPSYLNAPDEISSLKKELKLSQKKIQQIIAEKDSLMEEVKGLKEKLRVAEEQIQLVTAEKDAMMEELEIGVPSALPGVRGMEHKIIDLQKVIKRLEQENQQLCSHLSALKDRKENVGRQMDVQRAPLGLDAEASAARRWTTEASGLWLQQGQIQSSLLDLQEMLSIKTDELRAAHGQMETLEDIIEAQSQKVYLYKQEAEVIHISFSALCMKRDALQEEVAQKTKRLVILQEELAMKEKILNSTIMTKTSALQGELKSRERELTTRRMLADYQEALAQLRSDNELILRDNRRLEDDVTTMTMEKQAALVDMEEALHERNELKHRVNSYLITVSKIENLLKSKEQENFELLQQLHMANSDMQERGQRLMQGDVVINSIRRELLSSETDRRHLHEAVSHKEREIQQYMQDIKAYEMQLSTLVRGTSLLEEELRTVQEEKAVLLTDLASVRELCVKLDADNEVATRQLLYKSMELERATTRQDDAWTEVALLKEHLASEKSTIHNLERALATSRQEMFQAHQAAREKESELKVLRERLMQAENKIGEYVREISNLRSKVAQLQTKIEALNSQISGERHRREEMPLQQLPFRPPRTSSPVDPLTTPHLTFPDTSSIKKSD